VNAADRKDNVNIRLAAEKDAQAIYLLKREVFAAKYLLFTIYRSKKTFAHIGRLLASGDQVFLIAERHGELLGYANAICANKPPILNYIGVASVARGAGIGGSLLEAIESEMHNRGFRTMELDVFESNSGIVEWYSRSGCSIVSRSLLYRIDLAHTAQRSYGPQIDPLLLQSALAAEQHDGFSKLACNIRGGEITLGLIEGVACKLLGYQGLSLDDAVDAAVALVNGSRSEMIVSSLNLPNTKLPLLSCETIVRMAKEI
jgi:ribosomal protein S18 acetylase RimI-like enzyme